MKQTNQLALWLVLATDAMFIVALLGASRVLPRTTSPIAWLISVIVLLGIGRIVLRREPRMYMRGFGALIALAAMAIAIAQLLTPSHDITFLMHCVFIAHLAVLTVATLCTCELFLVGWNFVLIFGCSLLIASF